MEEIQVISTCLVGATSNNESISDNNTPKVSKIEMTPWDLQFLLLDTIQKGLLFHKPKENNTSFIDHLKTSLSRTLHFFPPLAGRFSTVKNDCDDTVSFFINCNNAGVEFTHAVSPKLTVSTILDSKHVPKIVHSLFPSNNTRNFECVTKPLFGVQITELVDGYFIGCTMSHSLGDGTCFWHFLNTWSEISRGYEVISKSAVLERYFPEKMDDPIHLPLKLDDEKLFEKFEVPPLMERIFHLSKESIGRLKGKANSEMDDKSISSLQAYLAHLWRSVTRCRKLDAEQEVVISVIVGARSRLHPPLPEGYFGNAVYIKQVETSAGELLKNGLGWAAMQMNKVVSSQNSEEVVKMYKSWAENPILFTKGSGFLGNTNLGISSSPRYNIYGTDFGWGKPVAVRSGMANKSDGKITLFPGIEEGSVDIEVCLLPETLQAMENDQEFMEAVIN
ncbi:protein ENHANCED PSEUDOMONAS SUSCEPTIBILITY 1-like [Lycium barbarum]|uniref:protein ENHANCED PSEUDOMONAS SUSCEPTIBILITY 1-like n=1 Tax=Lycium barbarum TaxID=112863 RepID=UPI00293F6594|nr:protein ENHANCED PSEUDOMONAS SUSCEPTIBILITY 1-like [Lycium barbarum]